MSQSPERPVAVSLRLRRTVAFVISVVAPGAGHFLLGRFRRGIVWLAAYAVCMLSVPFTMIVGVVGGYLARLGVVLDVLWVGGTRPPWKKVLIGWAGFLVLAVSWGVAVRTFYVQAFTMPAGSMVPTLLVGDYFLVNKFIYGAQIPFTDRRLPLLREPRRGDVIVFKYPKDESRDFVKRIVAIPGETLHIRGDEVLINGQPLAEPYVLRDPRGVASGQSSLCRDAYGCEPILVPPGSYFVMGDNRDNSQDSRHWGFVKREKIRGKVFLVYWSWDADRGWPRFNRIGQSPSAL